MSYDDPGIQHQNALSQVAQARQNALTAVSEARKAPPPDHDPHLAPANNDSPEHLSVVCTQAVVDYLLQLRPYRASSSTWNINFGTVTLPKKIPGDPSNVFGHDPDLRKGAVWLCRQPEVPLGNASQLIQAANMTVQYSTNHNHETNNLPNGRKPKRYRPTFPKDVGLKLLNGEISQEEAMEHATAPAAQTDGGEDEYEPASPFVSSSPRRGGKDGRLESYKFVFPAPTLLQIVELADEVAAELNLLADLRPQGEEDTTGF